MANYRKNVCAVIFNEHLQFLGCQRIREEKIQFVQGGVEKEEEGRILEAAYREIYEEIGLYKEDLHFVGEILPPSGDPTEFCYQLSERSQLRRYGYVGQEQRLILFFAPSPVIRKVRLIPPKETGASQEFSGVAWMPIEEIIKRCPKEKEHIFSAVRAVGLPMAIEFMRTHPVF